MNATTLTFDEHGYLAPHRGIETDLETFEEVFVKAFPRSERRRWLFDNYLRYTYRFQDEMFAWFEQWIDGSFISQKENPGDLDIVTIFDYQVFEARGEKMTDKFQSYNWERERIDAYLVYDYPPGHDSFSETILQKNKFLKLYGSTKPKTKGSPVFPKGFLKITFGK